MFKLDFPTKEIYSFKSENQLRFCSDTLSAHFISSSVLCTDNLVLSMAVACIIMPGSEAIQYNQNNDLTTEGIPTVVYRFTPCVGMY